MSNNKKSITLKIIFSILAAFFLMVQNFIPPYFLLANKWLAAIIASIVQFLVVSDFYKKAWKGFVNRKANMYSLIILGTLVAYFYSIFLLLFQSIFFQLNLPTNVYFDTAVSILAFILLGNYLEGRAIQRSSEAIEKLMKLQPSNTFVLRTSDNKKNWVELPLAEISLGDTLRVDPGSQIPVDGSIIQGSSSIDESMVTGESNPIIKKINDKVIGGTINLTNSFEMKAEKIGKDTMLAKIINLVEQAQKSKAPIERIVDVVASFFVPLIIVCSLSAFLIWFNFGPEPQLPFALFSMVSVLIIACPCALGLAIPISLIVATGRAAQAGILIKDAASLEKACTLEVMVFDKTGTLTSGRPSIIDFKWIDEKDSKNQFLLSLIKNTQERSKHPISYALQKYLEKNKMESTDNLIVKDFKSIPGYGTKAIINDYIILIGARRFFDLEKVLISEEISQVVNKWAGEGKTTTFIAVNGKLIAYFSTMDTIRRTAYQAIQELKSITITSILLTGDNKEIARAISKKLDITTFFASVLPEDKAKKIMELKRQNHSVGMVGDGINDAPALAAADVSIAMGEGTDIAFETAQMVLLHNDLILIPFVIQLSKATMRNIRQNLLWAFGYNIVLIPVAMGILYPFFTIVLNPMLAGAAMAFSSLSVVLNALRLKNFKKLQKSLKNANDTVT